MQALARRESKAGKVLNSLSGGADSGRHAQRYDENLVHRGPGGELLIGTVPATERWYQEGIFEAERKTSCTGDAGG